ncbi:MAG: peptidyl-prolyl cis-trans isomerase [Kiritimatiellae bacterium]|nr:peptidyl-prolyl cis-trans isomerase [Kiritimatiellia bacterium]
MTRNLRVFAAAALSAASLCAHAVEVDGVAATVGTDTILRSDVLNAMRRRGIADESRYDEVRNDLIDRALIIKAAAESKMTLQEWVVEDRVRTIVEDAFGGDRNKLVETLAREKVSYAEWRKRIKDDLIINAMRWNMVYKNVRATPSLMKAEYRAHPERYMAGGRTTVSVILLDPERSSFREAASDMVKTNSFAAAAKRYSVDSHASSGGVWKDVTPADVFKPEICDSLSKLKAGEVSDWISIDGWSFLLKKEEESTAHPMSFAEAYQQIEDCVREQESDRLYGAWIERLRAETYIRIY